MDTHLETLDGIGRGQLRVETEDKAEQRITKEGGFLWKAFLSAWLVVFFVCSFLLQTGSHYVALEDQELTI